MHPNWKVGLIGYGSQGSIYARFLASDPRCTLIACCDASHETLATAQESLRLPDNRCFVDYDEFISSDAFDIVLVGTPIPLHAEQSIRALEDGAHVLSEVTAAATVEDCGRIVDAVRRTGRTYMMAENCVFWPFVMEWRRMVQQGRIGDIVYAEAEYLHPIRELLLDSGIGQRWRAERPPLHYCSHSLGPLLMIMDDRITRALGVGNGNRIMPEVPVGGVDMQVALFETEKGAIIKMLRTQVAPRHPRIHYYTLQGTKGFLETDRWGPAGTGLLYIEGEMERAEKVECPMVDRTLPESARGGHGTAEYSLVQHFLAAIESGTPPLINEVRAMDLTVPGLIAQESVMRGSIWLDVPSFTDVRLSTQSPRAVP